MELHSDRRDAMSDDTASGQEGGAPDLPDLFHQVAPEIRALHALWTGLAAEGGLVTRAALTPFVLRPWLPHLSIFQRIEAGDFLVRLDGTATVALSGEDWTGRRLSQLSARYAVDLCARMEGVLVRRVPALLELVLVQKEHVAVDCLLLPVSSEGTMLDQVLSALYPRG